MWESRTEESKMVSSSDYIRDNLSIDREFLKGFNSILELDDTKKLGQLGLDSSRSIKSIWLEKENNQPKLRYCGNSAVNLANKNIHLGQVSLYYRISKSVNPNTKSGHLRLHKDQFKEKIIKLTKSPKIDSQLCNSESQRTLSIDQFALEKFNGANHDFSGSSHDEFSEDYNLIANNMNDDQQPIKISDRLKNNPNLQIEMLKKNLFSLSAKNETTLTKSKDFNEALLEVKLKDGKVFT